MLEEHPNKKQKQKSYWDHIKNNTFKVFVEFLRSRHKSKFSVSILFIISWLQIYGTLLEEGNYIQWNDDYAGSFVYAFFKIVRVIPILISHNATALYWVVYGLCNTIRF